MSDSRKARAAKRALLLAALAGIGALLANQRPEIERYLRVRAM